MTLVAHFLARHVTPDESEVPRRAILATYVGPGDGAIYALDDGSFIATMVDGDDIECPNIDRALAIFASKVCHGEDGVAMMDPDEVAQWRKTGNVNTHYPHG